MPSTLHQRRHDPAAQARYQDVKQLARSQARILAGTPGTLKQRTQSAKRYWVREYIRVDGKKTDEYIGPVAAVDAQVVTRLSGEIDLAKALAKGSSSLRLFGYQRIERKPAAALQVIHNKRLFQAGLALVGSHAYAALLNELGVLAPGYKTRDIDLARADPLAIALPAGASLQSILRETGLAFVPVPGIPSRMPSASFKVPGAEALAVDLLVPGKNIGQLVAVPELDAYAQAIPLLDFLVEEPVESIALSPNQVIPIRVPSPERFLLHKLLSSQSRSAANRDKVRKDLEQAAVLADAVEEETPGRISDVFREMPRTAWPTVRRGAKAAAKLLGDAHAAGRDVLLGISGR